MTASTEPDAPACPFPFGPATAPEPEPRYTLLRKEEPVSRVRLPFGGDAWLVTRYADVRTVLADPRFSRAATTEPSVARFEPVPPPPIGVFVSDPPEHSRLRSLVARAFTVRRVEQLRPRIRALATSLLDGLLAAGPPADFVTGFALPYSVTIISDLLGIPEADRERFRRGCDALLSTTALTREEVHATRGELSAFLREVTEAKRAAPADDLISALVSASEDQDRLSEQELIIFLGGLLTAGYETSASQLANFVFLLLRDPAAWQILHGDADLVAPAVEELLRYVPSLAIGGFTRVAVADVELGGVLVRAGETVVPVLGSANHDEAHFADPAALTLDRSPNPHIAFGHGPHRCVGAQLARVELQEALAVLTARVPGLRLAEPATQVPWKDGLMIRGVRELPLTW